MIRIKQVEENTNENEMKENVLDELQHIGEDMYSVIRTEDVSDSLQHTYDINEDIIKKRESTADECDILTVKKEEVIMESGTVVSGVKTESEEEIVFHGSLCDVNIIVKEELILEESHQKHFEDKMKETVVDELQHVGEDMYSVIKTEDVLESLQCTYDINKVIIEKDERSADECDILTVKKEEVIIESDTVVSGVKTESEEDIVFHGSLCNANTIMKEEPSLEESHQKHFEDEHLPYVSGTIENEIVEEALNGEKRFASSNESNIGITGYLSVSPLVAQQTTSEKRYEKHKCDEYVESFTGSVCWLKHEITQNDVIKPTCNICNKTFTWPCQLSRHNLIHSGIKNHQCDVCEKSFTHRSSLSQHMSIHSGIKNYQCDVCKKSFTRRSNFSKHKLFHSGTKNYQCDVCKGSFTQRGSLLRHMLIHSGIKNYQCDVCKKSFIHRGSLLHHMLIHNGIKNHQCDVCQKSFTHRGSLSRHKLIHSGIKNHQCDRM